MTRHKPPARKLISVPVNDPEGIADRFAAELGRDEARRVLSEAIGCYDENLKWT